jgi:hypothetical protein
MATARADAAKQVTDRDLLSIIHQVRRGHTQAPSNRKPAAAAAR